MRAKYWIMAIGGASALALTSAAHSQQKQQTVTQVPATMQERLRVQLPVPPVRARLQTELEMRRFVAQELERPEQVIGLLEQIVMQPARGDILREGKAYITVGGRVEIDPSELKFEMKRNGSFFLKVIPHVRGRSTPYLVSAVVKVREETRMSTVATTGGRIVTGMERLLPGEHHLNFVVQKFGPNTQLQLFADKNWQVETIKVTPVTGG